MEERAVPLHVIPGGSSEPTPEELIASQLAGLVLTIRALVDQLQHAPDCDLLRRSLWLYWLELKVVVWKGTDPGVGGLVARAIKHEPWFGASRTVRCSVAAVLLEADQALQGFTVCMALRAEALVILRLPTRHVVERLERAMAAVKPR